MASAGPSVLRFQAGAPQRRQYGERLRLLIKDGPQRNQCFCLIGDVVVLGRESDCDLVLSDAKVSRKHIEFRWTGQNYKAKDLGSQIGFIHNGQKVNEANLQAGDTLVVGLTVMALSALGSDGALQIAGVTAAKSNRPSANATQDRPFADPKLARKRLMIAVGLVFLFLIILSDPSERVKTFRERAKIDIEVANKPNSKIGIREVDKAKQEAVLARKEAKALKKEVEADRKEVEAAKKEVEAILSDIAPNYKIDPQNSDADTFFHLGVRELQNKNYHRALMNFDTALSVDASHDLAKVYKEITKREFEQEVKAAKAAATRANKSLRFREARMHYNTIVRYLEADKDNLDYVEAVEELQRLDKIEQVSP